MHHLTENEHSRRKTAVSPETPKCSLLQEAVKTELSGSLRQFSPRLAENGTPFPPGIVNDAAIPILAVVSDMGVDVEVGHNYKNFWPPTICHRKPHDLFMQVLTRETLKESGGYIVEEGGEISNDGDRKAKDAAASSWKKRRRLVFTQNPGVIQVNVYVLSAFYT